MLFFSIILHCLCPQHLWQKFLLWTTEFGHESYVSTRLVFLASSLTQLRSLIVHQNGKIVFAKVVLENSCTTS